MKNKANQISVTHNYRAIFRDNMMQPIAGFPRVIITLKANQPTEKQIFRKQIDLYFVHYQSMFLVSS